MPAILRFDEPPSPVVLREAGRVVAGGGLLVVPTESFYGLAASVWHDQAVARVGALKGRPDDKPLLVLIGAQADLDALSSRLPPAGLVLMQRFWPGPLTVVVPAAAGVPVAVTAGTGTVGVRVPGSSRLRDLLRGVGPLTGTSANRSGAPPPMTVREVLAGLGSGVDAILDGGQTPGGAPSTVVTVVDALRILREGAIPADAIHEVWRSAGFDQ